ncbi:glycosyltransferase [Streptomyces olivoreticuli]
MFIDNRGKDGGATHATIALAGSLSRHHEVELVNIYRDQDHVPYVPALSVKVVDLIDMRPGSPLHPGDDPAFHRPSGVILPVEPRYRTMNQLSDRKVAEYLAQCDADVVIANRYTTANYLGLLCTDRYAKVAVAHMIYQSSRHQHAFEEFYKNFDAIVPVSSGDIEYYKARPALSQVRIASITNGVAAPRVPVSDQNSRILMAAGALIDVKRYHLLIDGFALLAAEFPDWELRIYGSGKNSRKLRAQVEHLGLQGRVFLMGRVSSMADEWAKASVAACTSSMESQGLGLVEAMRHGVPVVSMDCDNGPREVIRDGEDGILTPMDDVGALAAGLRRLMADDALRRAMAAAAVRNSERFNPDVVAGEFTALLEEVLAARKFKPRADVRCLDHGRALLRITEETVPSPGMRLVLRPERQGQKCVYVPLRAVSGEHSDEAALEAELAVGERGLTDGQWAVEVERPADGARAPLELASNDRRVFLCGSSAGLSSPVRVLKPYMDAGRQTWLWVRAPRAHAEIRDLRVQDGLVTVDCEFMGCALTEAPMVHLRVRGRAKESLSVMSRVTGPRTFQFAFSARTLAERLSSGQASEIFDVWATAGTGVEAAVGILHADVHQHLRTVYAYPQSSIDVDGEAICVEPYMTKGNNLLAVGVNRAPSDA